MPRTSQARSERTAHDEEQIEKWIVAREHPKCLLAIHGWLRQARKSDPRAIFRACDWYRRLGFHEKGLALLPASRSQSGRNGEAFQRECRLWRGRFLNLLGAPGFALSCLQDYRAQTSEEYRILGSIQLANFQHAQAAQTLTEMARLESDLSSYRHRLSLINLADAHYSSGRKDEAFSIARRVFEDSSEPLLRGIARTALGEYHCRSDEPLLALRELAAAEQDTPTAECGFDRAMILKYTGYSLLKLKRSKDAVPLLDRAFQILYSLSLRPEAWLDVVRIKAEHGVAGPEEQGLLLYYPGLAPYFRKSVELLNLGSGSSGAFSTVVRLHLDPARDEYRWKSKTIQSGIPLELKLLCAVLQSGSLGMPMIRLFELLWPDEFHAFLQLRGRLDQLLKRLRGTYACNVTLCNGLLRVVPETTRTLSIANFPSHSWGDVAPSLLASLPAPSVAEVMKYYGVSKPTAIRRMAEWRERGWLPSKRDK